MDAEHLAKIAQHDSSIDSLTKGQDKLSDDIHNLETKLETGISRIFGKLDAITQSSRPDVKGVLMGLIATTAVMLTAIGLFVKLTVDPLKAESASRSARIDNLQSQIITDKVQSAEARGYARAREKHINAMLERDKQERELLRQHVLFRRLWR